MCKIYYPPENVNECQANNVPISVFCGWAVQNGDPKLDLLVQAGFLRSVDVPTKQISKPGFVDEHIDVVSGKLTRAELAKKLNLRIVENASPPPPVMTVSSPANNPFTNAPQQSQQIQEATPLQFPDNPNENKNSPSDSMDLLEILNKRHGTQSPPATGVVFPQSIDPATGLDLSVAKMPVGEAKEEDKPPEVDPTIKTYKMEDIRKMSDVELGKLAELNGIDLTIRNTRQKRINDLVRIGILVS